VRANSEAHRILIIDDERPILLTLDSFLAPARGFANILRFRPPWYRDSRIVKANSFFSDAGEGVSASTAEQVCSMMSTTQVIAS
jgi:hypothetical protein